MPSLFTRAATLRASNVASAKRGSEKRSKDAPIKDPCRQPQQTDCRKDVSGCRMHFVAGGPVKFWHTDPSENDGLSAQGLITIDEMMRTIGEEHD